MKRRDTLFIAGVALVVAVLFVLSTTGRKPPDIPQDVKHAALTTNKQCLACHAPGLESPLKEKHPPKEQCLECHKLKPGGQG